MTELRRLLEPAHTFLERVPAGAALATKARASDLDQRARSTAIYHPLPIVRDVPQLIDHTILKPEAGPADIERLCHEARQAAFASGCLNSSHVARAAKKLAGSGVRVCAVVGFPLGAAASRAKALETAAAIETDVRRMRAIVGPQVGVKAAGGIRSRADLERMVRAGACRVGTSSGLGILQEYAQGQE